MPVPPSGTSPRFRGYVPPFRLCQQQLGVQRAQARRGRGQLATGRPTLDAKKNEPPPRNSLAAEVTCR